MHAVLTHLLLFVLPRSLLGVLVLSLDGNIGSVCLPLVCVHSTLISWSMAKVRRKAGRSDSKFRIALPTGQLLLKLHRVFTRPSCLDLPTVRYLVLRLVNFAVERGMAGNNVHAQMSRALGRPTRMLSQGWELRGLSIDKTWAFAIMKAWWQGRGGYHLWTCQQRVEWLTVACLTGLH